jgi:zinc protease
VQRKARFTNDGLRRIEHTESAEAGNVRGMSRMWRHAGVRIAAGVCWVAVVGRAAPANARSPRCEQVERYTLKNGLEVVLRPDHELPNVALVSSVHAGFRNDPSGHEGLAHYVEHLTFLEALSLGGVNDLYQQAGATNVNAVTKLDTTDYFAQLPRAQIERGLWIEARRIAIGVDTLHAGPAEEEHQVILREHELRFGAGLGLEASSAIFQALYPEGHPLHALGRQTESSVGALTLDDARWFFARYYRPDRIRLTLLGDFDPAAVRPLVDKYFGALAGRELPEAPGTPAPSLAEADVTDCRRAQVSRAPLHGRVVISTRGAKESVAFLWQQDADGHPERWWGILDTFARRVGDAARDAKLAIGAHMNLQRTELGDHWMMSVDLLPGQPFDRVPPLMASVFAQLKRSPPDAGEQSAERQFLAVRESQQRTLLSRALDLSQRECVPSRCLAVAEQLSPETITGIDRFDPARALRVELRHSDFGSVDGDVERVP